MWCSKKRSIWSVAWTRPSVSSTVWIRKRASSMTNWFHYSNSQEMWSGRPFGLTIWWQLSMSPSRKNLRARNNRGYAYGNRSSYLRASVSAFATRLLTPIACKNSSKLTSRIWNISFRCGRETLKPLRRSSTKLSHALKLFNPRSTTSDLCAWQSKTKFVGIATIFIFLTEAKPR